MAEVSWSQLTISGNSLPPLAKSFVSPSRHFGFPIPLPASNFDYTTSLKNFLLQIFWAIVREPHWYLWLLSCNHSYLSLLPVRSCKARFPSISCSTKHISTLTHQNLIFAALTMGGNRKGKGGSKEAKPAAASRKDSASQIDSSLGDYTGGDMNEFLKLCREAQSFDPELQIETRARKLEKLPDSAPRNHAMGRSLLICESSPTVIIVKPKLDPDRTLWDFIACTSRALQTQPSADIMTASYMDTQEIYRSLAGHSKITAYLHSLSMSIDSL